MKQHPSEWKSVSDETKRLNPHLFGGTPMGGLQAEVTQPTPTQALDRSHAEQPAGAQSVQPSCSGAKPRKGQHTPQVRVTLVTYRKRIIDDDNNVGACKQLRDAIAKWINLDDGDPRWCWEYAQVLTRGAEGVAVRLEW
jgi:hypothetical protein